jgi:holo-[acyl-carrier protein] synthase
MGIHGIGIDVADTERFFPFKKDKKNRFLTDSFSGEELEYCFSFRDPTEHLAGTFAAKEAAWKAFGKNNVCQSALEIRRTKTGKPEVWIKNRRQKTIFISISHTKQVAVAIAIAEK